MVEYLKLVNTKDADAFKSAYTAELLEFQEIEKRRSQRVSEAQANLVIEQDRLDEVRHEIVKLQKMLANLE